MKQFKFLILIALALVSITVSAQEKGKPRPEFKEIYFVNRYNERVTELRVEDEFMYMVVETANAIGEKVTLSLDEEDGDFIYKGKYVSANDDIKLKIRKNIQKIKFIIYNSALKKHRKLKEKAKAKKKE
ncbi:hypothetical protein [Aquimarina sp. AU119]|uniref:hypothetical protein n=1 Tax=Aquimarina sp. AU119 TaxID=2108528 RepID=UPI000D69045C|nr:hypothetical protein [Aquimarina sp. AU119]